MSAQRAELHRSQPRRRISVAFPRDLVLKTMRPGVGWIGRDTTEIGFEWDFETATCLDGDVDPDDVLDEEGGMLEVPVFQLELEGGQGYFVGTHGVWVRGAVPRSGSRSTGLG